MWKDGRGFRSGLGAVLSPMPSLPQGGSAMIPVDELSIEGYVLPHNKQAKKVVGQCQALKCLNGRQFWYYSSDILLLL